jgi:hypothetical protein
LPIFSNLPLIVRLPFDVMADDGSNIHLWNVGRLQRDYTALHPRRLSSSQSPPWEPEILQPVNCRSRFYPVSIIPPCSPCSYTIREMNNRPVVGCSSETQSHTIDMIMNNFEQTTAGLLFAYAYCMLYQSKPLALHRSHNSCSDGWLAASKLNVGLNDSSSIPSRASIASRPHCVWGQPMDTVSPCGAYHPPPCIPDV